MAGCYCNDRFIASYDITKHEQWGKEIELPFYTVQLNLF